MKIQEPTGFFDQSTKSNATKHNEEKIPIIPSRKPEIHQEPTRFLDQFTKSNVKQNQEKIPIIPSRKPVIQEPTGFLDQSKSNVKHNEEKIPIIPSRKPVIQEPTGLSKSNTLPWIKKSKPPLPPMKPPPKVEIFSKPLPTRIFNLFSANI